VTEPLIEVLAVVKPYGLDEPLRVAQLRLASTDRVVLSGLDEAGAETLMHLLTGASLPEEGEIRVAGRATREIATDAEWLDSLDRFGLVSDRAVLFEQMPTAASLALPMSLSIEPMPPDLRRQVDEIASVVGLAAATIDAPVSALTAAERLQVHLARAIAHRPAFVLLERPTAHLESAAARRTFGQLLAAVSAARGFGWLAVTDDSDFAAGAGGSRLILDASGAIRETRRSAGRWVRDLWTKARA
jgi:ABC-type lipoprotein export system ATPase subunit